MFHSKSLHFKSFSQKSQNEKPWLGHYQNNRDVCPSKKDVWTNELFKGKKKRATRKSLKSQGSINLSTEATIPTETPSNVPPQGEEMPIEEGDQPVVETEPAELVDLEEEPRDYNLAGEMVVNQDTVTETKVEESEEEQEDDNQPFGLGSIIDLLDFITSLINLNDTNNADIIIKTCLRHGFSTLFY